jgi:hypothetical protein
MGAVAASRFHEADETLGKIGGMDQSPRLWFLHGLVLIFDR